MGGPRLTVAQLEKGAQVLAKTNSISAAAAAIHVNESTLRAAFKRARIARYRDLHGEAIERGLRAGRKRLTKAVKRLGDKLLRRLGTEPGPSHEAEEASGLSVGADASANNFEPLNVLQETSAFAVAMRELVRLDLLRDRHRQARLTREKTRAEIARIRKDTDGEGGEGSALKVPKILTTERPDIDAPAPAPAPNHEEPFEPEP